jgi:hypothetical protein
MGLTMLGTQKYIQLVKPSINDPSSFVDEIALQKSKRNTLPGTIKIPTELIQT